MYLLHICEVSILHTVCSWGFCWFVCLFKPLIKFCHSRFLFTGVQGWVLKDECRVQNAFLGRKKRKTTLQKQTAPWLVPLSPTKSSWQTQCTCLLQGYVRHIIVFRSGPVHTHIHAHSQNISRYSDYYYKSWFGCMGLAVAWRTVFWYAECVIAGLSDEKKRLCFVSGSGEQLWKSFSLPFPLCRYWRKLFHILCHVKDCRWGQSEKARQKPGHSLWVFKVWVYTLHCNLFPQWDFY